MPEVARHLGRQVRARALGVEVDDPDVAELRRPGDERLEQHRRRGRRAVDVDAIPGPDDLRPPRPPRRPSSAEPTPGLQPARVPLGRAGRDLRTCRASRGRAFTDGMETVEIDTRDVHGPADRGTATRQRSSASTPASPRTAGRRASTAPSAGSAADLASAFCHPDHEHREGVVAETDAGLGGAVLIGHVCLEPAPGGDVEMAVAVADRLAPDAASGGAMLARGDRLGAVARTAPGWWPRVRCGSGAVIGLVRSLGLPVSFRASADELAARIDIRRGGPARGLTGSMSLTERRSPSTWRGSRRARRRCPGRTARPR